MNDNMFNFTDRQPEPMAEKQTTLVISDVPSKVAYDIIMKGLSTGEGVSRDELVRQVERRTTEGSVHLGYSEILNYMKKVGLTDREEFMIEDGFSKAAEHRFGLPEIGPDGNLVRKCADCGYMIPEVEFEKGGFEERPISPEGMQDSAQPFVVLREDGTEVSLPSEQLPGDEGYEEHEEHSHRL